MTKMIAIGGKATNSRFGHNEKIMWQNREKRSSAKEEPVSDTPSQQLKVTKANDLVEATYRLTLNEQRLILLSISHLDSRKPPPTGQITISAADFSEQFGLDLKSTYHSMEEAANTLYERDIKRIRGGIRERIRWVYTVKYHDGEGKVTLGFSPEILPYLTLLHKRFTSYDLKRVSALNSVYSIRLFEMLTQYASVGVMIITVDELRERLDLGDKYQRYSHLKLRVIEPAVAELRQKSDLEIDWGVERKGRKVHKLIFEFRESEQRQLPF